MRDSCIYCLLDINGGHEVDCPRNPDSIQAVVDLRADLAAERKLITGIRKLLMECLPLLRPTIGYDGFGQQKIAIDTPLTRRIVSAIAEIDATLKGE